MAASNGGDSPKCINISPAFIVVQILHLPIDQIQLHTRNVNTLINRHHPNKEQIINKKLNSKGRENYWLFEKMADGGVEKLLAFFEDLVGGRADVRRRGVVEWGHFGKSGVILLRES